MAAFRILEDFYREVMRSYPPQGEALLERIRPEKWRQISFRYIFSVKAMTTLSHIIEDAAAQSRRTADLHVSFQVLSRFLPQQNRYLEISTGIARGWIYGALDIPDVSGLMLPASMRWVNTGETPLVEYWFVIAYGPGLAMTLLAREIPAIDRVGRYYEGFYTFEGEIAYQVLMILHILFPADVPMPSRPEEQRW